MPSDAFPGDALRPIADREALHIGTFGRIDAFVLSVDTVDTNGLHSIGLIGLGKLQLR